MCDRQIDEDNERRISREASRSASDLILYRRNIDVYVNDQWEAMSTNRIDDEENCLTSTDELKDLFVRRRIVEREIGHLLRIVPRTKELSCNCRRFFCTANRFCSRKKVEFLYFGFDVVVLACCLNMSREEQLDWRSICRWPTCVERLGQPWSVVVRRLINNWNTHNLAIDNTSYDPRTISAIKRDRERDEGSSSLTFRQETTPWLRQRAHFGVRSNFRVWLVFIDRIRRAR